MQWNYLANKISQALTKRSGNDQAQNEKSMLKRNIEFLTNLIVSATGFYGPEFNHYALA
jgi:hypothetical protein